MKQDPQAFDAVITDMTMPKMTGFKVAKELLLIRPDLPIILCSGDAEGQGEKNLTEQGFRGFLQKPFIMREMAETLRAILDQKTG